MSVLEAVGFIVWWVVILPALVGVALWALDHGTAAASRRMARRKH